MNQSTNIFKTKKLSAYVSLLAGNLLLILPLVGYAAFSDTSAQAFLQEIIDKILRPAANILLVLATVLFLIGMVEYIAGASSETARTTGRDHFLWGTIGLGIMISVRIILQVLSSFFYPNGA